MAIADRIELLGLETVYQDIAQRTGLIPVGAKLRLLADEHPDKTAIVVASKDRHEVALTFHQLDRRSNSVARLLLNLGVSEGDAVFIALPNCIEHVIATWAAWKLGATVLPVDPSMSSDSMGKFALSPKVIIHQYDCLSDTLIVRNETAFVASSEILACALSSDPIEIKAPRPGYCLATGGSTGVPKLIVDDWWLLVPIDELTEPEQLRVSLLASKRQLVCGPLFHGLSFMSTYLLGLANGQTVILMERFNADYALELIERYRVNFSALVPTMMRRMLRSRYFFDRDLSSIDQILHSAAPCPPDVKRGWIERIGSKRVWEVYSASELIGSTYIRGDDWLNHIGSVGRPVECDVRILADNGRECGPNEVGEIYMRRHRGVPNEYLTCDVSRQNALEGFRSVGDLGCLDSEGYLYISSRRSDLIITGGTNIYPTELESVLLQHPAVLDCAVIGMPDDDLGQRAHAIVSLRGDIPADDQDLRVFCAQRLPREQQPRSYELVDILPRNEAGKLRKSALITDRVEVK